MSTLTAKPRKTRKSWKLGGERGGNPRDLRLAEHCSNHRAPGARGVELRQWHSAMRPGIAAPFNSICIVVEDANVRLRALSLRISYSRDIINCLRPRALSLEGSCLLATPVPRCSVASFASSSLLCHDIPVSRVLDFRWENTEKRWEKIRGMHGRCCARFHAFL